MKILRITGHFKGKIVDVRLTTDLIDSTSDNFTVSQVQVGTEFESNDPNDRTIQAALGEHAQLKQSNLISLKAFCQRECYNLSIANSDGSGKVVLIDCDESSSASI
jgi:hypothetical protein